MTALKERVSKAVRFFWKAQESQGNAQGRRTGQKDAGRRSAVTGGKQLNGFHDLIADVLAESGVPRDCIVGKNRAQVVLPGYYRATKQWDLIVVMRGKLLATVELKSLLGPRSATTATTGRKRPWAMPSTTGRRSATAPSTKC